MALTSGSFALSVSTKAAGTIASQGNAPSNAVTDPSTTASSGRTQSLSYGTTSGKADIICCAEISLSATTAATYDLYTGTDIKDLFGGTAAFRKVKAVVVEIRSGGDASGVAIGGAASNAWAGFFADATDKALIFPSGPPYVAGSPAGVAVGSSTKSLKVENLGAVAVVLRVYLAGTSA